MEASACTQKSQRRPEIVREIQINIKQGTEAIYKDRGSSSSRAISMKRNTNFDLGYSKPTRASESASRYKPLTIPIDSPYQKPHVSIDARMTHFTLGSSQQKLITTAQDFKPCVGETAEKAITPSFSAAHHFEFGTDKSKAASKSPKGERFCGIDAQQLADLKTELKSSHFVLGSEKGLHPSSSKDDFKAKLGEIAKSNTITIKKISLGSEKTVYQSVSAKNFDRKAISNLRDTSSRMNEQRKNHFVIGYNNDQNSPVSRDLKGSAFTDRVPSQLEYLKRSHFKMGTSTQPYLSTYAFSHSPSPCAAKPPIHPRPDDLRSHFHLGLQTEKTESTNHQDFKLLTPSKNPNPGQSHYIREHHFKLGTQKTKLINTSSDYGKPSSALKQTDPIPDLKSSHIYIGYDDGEMISTNHRAYKAEPIAKPEQFKLPQSFHLASAGKIKWNTEKSSRFVWPNPQ